MFTSRYTPAPFISRPVRFDSRGYVYEGRVHLIEGDPSLTEEATALCGRKGMPGSKYGQDSVERLMSPQYVRAQYGSCKRCADLYHNPLTPVGN